jgi:riboflavin kinase/FMN adenylyltransferase
MKIIRSIQEVLRDQKSVVTVGTFDGVHRGHEMIIGELVERAKSRSLRSVLITFDPHPREVVKRGPVQYLTTLDERLELLQQMNLEVIVVHPFTYEFSRLSPRQFYQDLVNKYIGMSEVVVGHDHMFGKDREAGISELKKIGEEIGFSVTPIGPVTVDEAVVSSSSIRELLMKGNVEQTEKYLGRKYSIAGTVIQGVGRGAQIGFPTANLRVSHQQKLIPQNGVYFVCVHFNGHQYFGMMNIGVRPTFGSNGTQHLEVNVFDFNGDLYGKTLRVEFVKRIRSEQQFTSVDELVAQLHRDKEISLKLVLELYQS